jgi:hypothetical protein
LLQNASLNKGTGFTEQERQAFGLHGLLPSGVQTVEEQANRAYQQFQGRADDLAKNAFMKSLKEQNEVLYYRVGDHYRITSIPPWAHTIHIWLDVLTYRYHAGYSSPSEGDVPDHLYPHRRRGNFSLLEIVAATRRLLLGYSVFYVTTDTIQN